MSSSCSPTILRHRSSTFGARSGSRALTFPLIQGQRPDCHPEVQRVPKVSRAQPSPYSTRRLPFLLVHYVPLLAQLLIVRAALQQGHGVVVACTLLALSISGAFCAYVAWHIPEPEGRLRARAVGAGHIAEGLLPLRKQPLPLAVVLAVPFGFLQWVIVDLHLRRGNAELLSRSCSGGIESVVLEQPHKTRSCPERNAGASPDNLKISKEVRRSVHPAPAQGDSARFVNYKALTAIVESMLTSTAILYTHWTLGIEGYLHGHSWTLVCSEVVVLFSGGWGLLHMDYCCSSTVQERTKRPGYMWCHGFFRTCEMISRLSVLTAVAVMATCRSPWWWLLLVGEVFTSLWLVLAHGGLRNTCPAISICVVSATIVNVFCFVDSPSRLECARKVSVGLTRKHALETLLALSLLLLEVKGHSAVVSFRVSIFTSVGATLAYWALWPLLCLPWRQEPRSHDSIRQACQRGDLKSVRRLTKGEVRYDVDELDAFGITPLMYASLGGHAEICGCLLWEGASVLQQTVNPEASALVVQRDWSCAARCCLWVWRWFWEPAGRNWTALHLAAWKGHLEVLQVLLRHPDGTPRLQEEERLRVFDVDENTPLHVAGMYGRLDAYALIERLTLPQQEWSMMPNALGLFARDTIAGRELPVGQALDLDAGFLYQPSISWDALSVPVTAAEAHPHEVPLGLSSFMVCESSGQVGKLFVPDQLLATDSAAAFAERQRGTSRAIALHFEDLVPCREDGTPLEGRSPADPDTWLEDDVCLGRGSMGEVWRARDEQGGLYAVKSLTKECYPAALRDAQVALAVRSSPHPCLVKAFLYHQLPKHVCVVMEYCDGGTLKDAVLRAREACMPHDCDYCNDYQPPARALEWLAGVFLGLEHVHRRMDGIIRDLKPDNVGLACAGRRAKLLDFGSYRLAGPSLGRRSFGGENPQGTPGYISPELLRGPHDKATDFYSLGATIWVTLTGGWTPMVHAPFNEEFLDSHCCKDLADDWKLLRELVELQLDHDSWLPRLSAGAGQLILRLTEPEPARRCGHEEVRAALGRLLGRPLPAFEAQAEELEAWLAGA